MGYDLKAMDQWIDKSDNPFEIFDIWYSAARSRMSFEPTKMTLATVDSQGMPSARVVLLKKYDSAGFCFFTNYQSDKAKSLLEQKKAALVFHWNEPAHQQIRITGLVEKMTAQESDNYFQTRPRGSQIGAWASPQSQEVAGKQELENRVKEIEERFPEGTKISCPDFWGGFRVKPLSYEFWQSGEHRIHDRIRFERTDLQSKWQVCFLAP